MLNSYEALIFCGLFAVFLAGNYFLFSVGGYYFFYVWLGPRVPHRKILEAKPTITQIASEKRRSLQTQIIFYIMGIGLYVCYKLGYTQAYFTPNERGMPYFFLSYLIIHQLHDAYFYWTHRLMHEWRFLRKYHFIHHGSCPPTPYSALSFHPVEAFIHGCFWYLIALLIPAATIWLFFHYILMFYFNMWGHTPYEFWPKDLLTHPILKIFNTPTHHNLHHKYHQSNYSIYYNLWDILCGTNHPNYESHYIAVKEKTDKGKTSAIMKFLKL